MVNKTMSAMLEGLFPNYCSLCGLRSHRPVPLCLSCEAELQANNCCCHRCAVPLPPSYPASTDRLCGTCLRAPPPFARVIAPWLYCERLAYLIHRWKYQRERRLTPLLASLWLQRAEHTAPVDLIVPVPLHWRRLWHRGFNQAELLCRQLHCSASFMAAATVDHRGVRRRRPTGAQSSMSAIDRTANLRDAFTVSRRYDNLRIALVDDVLTTGATAASLAGVMGAAGASHVEVWCLARTPAPGE